MASKQFDICLESDIPLVQQQGLNTNKDATFNGSMTVSGTVSLASAISSAGTVTAINAAAASGAGTQAFGFTTVSNFGIYMGSGIPTVTAATGSLYINYGGTGVASRLYVNSGTTNWVGVTTVS